VPGLPQFGVSRVVDLNSATCTLWNKFDSIFWYFLFLFHCFTLDFNLFCKFVHNLNIWFGAIAVNFAALADGQNL